MRGLPHYLNTSSLDPDPSTSRSLRRLQLCNLRVKHLQGTEKALAIRSSFLSAGAVVVVIYLCIHLCFWLRCFFVTGCGLSLAAVSGSYSLLSYVDFSLCSFLCCGAQALGTGAQ